MMTLLYIDFFYSLESNVKVVFQYSKFNNKSVIRDKPLLFLILCCFFFVILNISSEINELYHICIHSKRKTFAFYVSGRYNTCYCCASCDVPIVRKSWKQRKKNLILFSFRASTQHKDVKDGISSQCDKY